MQHNTNPFMHSLKKLGVTLFGKFDSPQEVKKFSFLGLIFGAIIATYWALRPMKDGIFMAIVGKPYMPKAKMLSLVVIIPLVILYGKLVDRFPRQRVFYFLVGFYALLAIFFAWGFYHPTIGLANTTKDYSRLIGWAWYVYVESFGSLIVALFWAIVADITDSESAKSGFFLIGLFGQTGNIIGPFFLRAQFLGFKTSAPVVAICAALMVLTIVLFYLFVRTTPRSQIEHYHVKSVADAHKEKETEPGFLEGLKLLVSHGYLMGLFVIITAYEAIVTIFDFHFKSTVQDVYQHEALVSDFLGKYGSCVGVVATLCILLGIGNIQRKLGMRISLLLLPILVALAVLAIKFNPTSLWYGFAIMVSLKAINYALNQPTMKQLYIPTSKDAKYKSQAWIEMFGSRGSKALGSAVNDTRDGFIDAAVASGQTSVAGLSNFLTLALVVSFATIGCWLLVVIYVASIYNKAIKENRLVC